MITDSTLSADAGVTYPDGYLAAAVRCGLKTEGDDLAVIVSDRPATAAGVFTTNQVKASCVLHSREIARAGSARAIVCNAGNANACNGARGDRDTKRMAECAAQALGVAPDRVLVASTGVIGHPLPMERVEPAIARAASAVRRGPEIDQAVVRAIMTTDTRPKLLAAEFRSDAWPGPLRIGAVCKGSGMIAPNMATMLCFLTTDAQVEPALLQQALTSAVRRTFNRVTVDSDTSTNDMCLALANGAGPVRIEARGPAADDLAEALRIVCERLARQIARDGEGATKLVEVEVRGAACEQDADRIARTIAESPLVKTALFGNDPNWGRIVAAAGRAGVPFDPETLRVELCGIEVFRNGAGVEFDAQAARAALQREETSVVVDLGAGGGAAKYWTCDFSYDYVRINADYHT